MHSTIPLLLLAIALFSFIVPASVASRADGRRESAVERLKRERQERRGQRKSELSLAQRERERRERARQHELEEYRTGKRKWDLPANASLRIGVKHRPKHCNANSRKSRRGDHLKVHYNGTLYSDGRQIDCSVDREQPFEFVLGAGTVMEGWEKGCHNMCVGEKRKLTIPSGLAYGEAGGSATEGRIPPGATLVYEIELLRINNGRH